MNPNLTKQSEQTDWLQILFALAAVAIGGGVALVMMELLSPFFIIAGIIGAIGALVIFFYPEWGLVGLVAIVYTNLSDVLQWRFGAPSIAQPYIVLLCGVIVARWAIFGERPRGLKVPTLLVGMYGFSTFLSLFYAQNYNIAQEGLFDYIKLAIVTLLVGVLLRHGPTFRKVIWTLIAVGAFLGTISVLQSTTGTFTNSYAGFARPPIVSTDYGEDTARTAGPLGDPNFFAQIMVVLIPLALDRLWNARMLWARIAAGYALAMTVMTVFITFSRGAFLAMVIGVGVMFIGRRINPLTLIVTPLLAVMLLAFAPANYTERLQSLTDFLPGQSEEGSTDISFRGRTSEMLAAVMMFQDYPLLGVGVGNYNVRYIEYSRDIGLDGRLENRSAHSLYLEIAAERGLFGLLAFSILIGVTFYNLFVSSRALSQSGHEDMAGMIKALGAGLIAYLFASIFLHDAFPRFFWLIIGVCLSTIHVTRDELTRAADAPRDEPIAFSSIPSKAQPS